MKDVFSCQWYMMWFHLGVLYVGFPVQESKKVLIYECRCNERLDSPPRKTFMWNVEVHHERHWTRPIHELGYQLNVSTTLSQWPQLLTTCWVLTLWVVRNWSSSWSTAQSWAFLAPEWEVHVLTWSPRAYRRCFLSCSCFRKSFFELPYFYFFLFFSPFFFLSMSSSVWDVGRPRI